MKKSFDHINKQLKNGESVIVDKEIIEETKTKPVPVDVVTCATMSTTFRKMSEKYQANKGLKDRNKDGV
jgi:Uncharacterized conserved protein